MTANQLKHTTICRARLASLWLSQAARNVADNSLRVFVLLWIAEAGQAQRDYAWHLVAALLMVPAVLLAPCNGALGNSLPKRWVLTGSALYCLLVVTVFGLLDGHYLGGWALLAVGATIYSPTRYAILPAAAVDTHIPLTRVNGWIEMAAVSAVVGGLALGVYLEPMTWLGLPAPVTAAIWLNLAAVVTSLPAAFPSDVRRAEKAIQAIRGFFTDMGRIWRDSEARTTLLALSGLRGLVAGATGAFLAVMLNDDSVSMATRIQTSFTILAWVLPGAAVGSLLAGVERHPCRALGLVPLGATGLAIGLILAAAASAGSAVCFILGVMCGLINVPLAAAYQLYLPADARGNGMAVRNMFDYVMMTASSVVLFGLARGQILSGAGQLWLVAICAVLGAVVAWRKLYREVIELLMEIALLPIYRIKAHGPGLYEVPLRGPLLVVANHTAWFDPIWMAKVMPRSLRPMMTSLFYDLPFMRWLMKYIARAIRVQYSTYRREAPELKEAIQALDEGECVLLFPEGSLRKTEDRALRRFGQGVWHILQERPQTPVSVCWIEGGWGSFFSYWKGPPAKNKRMDFWRHIDVAVGQPQRLPEEMLADHKLTRTYLEKCCREMRGELGLEVPRADTAAETEREEVAS